MAGYIGPIPVPQATQNRETFTATASQTSFATGGYQAGYLDVFMNGVKLVDGSDYTATNGSDVVLATGAAVNDIIEVVSYSAFEVLNQNFTGTTVVDDLTVGGDLTVTGTTITLDHANAQTVDLGDNDKIRLGDGDDLQIYHDGTRSYLDDVGSGSLWLRGGDVAIKSTASETMAEFANNGAATLYYDNAVKFATTSAGIDVSGGIVCSPNTAGKDTFELSTSAVNEGRLRIKNVDTTTVEIRAGGDSYFNGGHVEIGSGRLRLGGGGNDQGTQLNLWSDTSGPAYIAAYQLNFNTGGNSSRTTAMKIDNNGDVEVYGKFKTASTGDAFNTTTSSHASGYAMDHYENSNDANNAWGAGRWHDGRYVISQKPSSATWASDATQRLIIDTSGRVGIGVSPSSTLDISSAANTTPLEINAATDGYNYSTIRNAAGNDVGYFGLGSALVSSGSADDFALRAQRNALVFMSGGNAERMRIDSAGRVTKPYQPSFRVQGTGAWTSYLAADTYHKLALSQSIFNIGGNYNTSSYDFTAPVAGMYQFTVDMYAQHGGGQDDDNQHWTARFGKNGGVISQPHMMKGYTNQGDNDTTGAMTSLVYCAANDTIQVYIRGHSGATIRYYAPACCFSGYLVG